LSKIYSKLSKALFSLEYFAFSTWTWRNDNVQSLWAQLGTQDRSLFFFDMGQMNWKEFCQAIMLGMRVYLVKDGIHTLPAARRKWQR
ncbi:hypothetical protein WDU94_009964, partial [Cyamophila willieti]